MYQVGYTPIHPQMCPAHWAGASRNVQRNFDGILWPRDLTELNEIISYKERRFFLYKI